MSEFVTAFLFVIALLSATWIVTLAYRALARRRDPDYDKKKQARRNGSREGANHTKVIEYEPHGVKVEHVIAKKYTNIVTGFEYVDVLHRMTDRFSYEEFEKAVENDRMNNQNDVRNWNPNHPDRPN